MKPFAALTVAVALAFGVALPTVSAHPHPPAPAYHQAFAEVVLESLNASAHPNAVAFLVGWAQSENCPNHNPFCRLRWVRGVRHLYAYPTMAAGAEAMAANLDAHHPDRPTEWRNHYPAITNALRNAHHFANPTQIVESVRPELIKWLGYPSAHYPARIARRAEVVFAEINQPIYPPPITIPPPAEPQRPTDLTIPHLPV